MFSRVRRTVQKYPKPITVRRRQCFSGAYMSVINTRRKTNNNNIIYVSSLIGTCRRPQLRKSRDQKSRKIVFWRKKN